jgi:hypothetical protein
MSPKTVRAWSRFALALALAATTSCKREAQPAPTAASVVPLEHRFAIAVGGATVRLRVAVFPNERNHGLMGVESLAEDEGMLFVFESNRRMSFYMRNTLVPLDIGYFDAAGVLREIHPMFPGIEDAVPSARADLRYALEMNQGWFERHGVRAGALLDVHAVSAAVAARGAAPAPTETRGGT